MSENIISNNPAWIEEQRKNAQSKFNSLKMPKLKYGISIKIDLKDFSFEKCDAAETPLQKITHQKEMIVLDFYDAIKKYPLILKKMFSTFEEEITKFDAFHIANWKKTTIVILPENIVFTEPLYLENVFKNSNVQTLLVIAEPNSSATIIDETSNNGNKEIKLNSKVVEIFADNNSKINFLSLQNCDSTTHTFSVKRAIAQNNAKINWLDCNMGSSICVSETTTFLKGNCASTNNFNIFFGKNEQKFDIYSKSIHEGKNTVSEMLTRGVLDDSAKAIYRGVLKITPTANGSSGYQKEDVTLLSPKAEADSIPELRINNNDITKCTHGASIGKVDAEKLFYLMSRGFPKKESVKKLIEGFFASILKNAGNDRFSTELQKLIEIKLETK